jgi:hypothetical protein
MDTGEAVDVKAWARKPRARFLASHGFSLKEKLRRRREDGFLIGRARRSMVLRENYQGLHG